MLWMLPSLINRQEPGRDPKAVLRCGCALLLWWTCCRQNGSPRPGCLLLMLIIPFLTDWRCLWCAECRGTELLCNVCPCRRNTGQRASAGTTSTTLTTQAALISSARSPQRCSTSWMRSASESLCLSAYPVWLDSLVCCRQQILNSSRSRHKLLHRSHLSFYWCCYCRRNTAVVAGASFDPNPNWNQVRPGVSEQTDVLIPTLYVCVQLF